MSARNGGAAEEMWQRISEQLVPQKKERELQAGAGGSFPGLLQREVASPQAVSDYGARKLSSGSGGKLIRIVI